MVLGIYGVAQNSGLPAIAPYDQYGTMCGITPGYEQHRFLYFADMEGSKSSIWDSGVCVRSCLIEAGDAPDCKATKDSQACTPPKFATMPLPPLPLACGYRAFVKGDVEASNKRAADF